jgi:hypothetical protein
MIGSPSVSLVQPFGWIGLIDRDNPQSLVRYLDGGLRVMGLWAVRCGVGRRLPDLDLQVVDFLEVPIAGDKRQVVLQCDGGNPNVIFRDWPPLETESVLYLPIPTRRFSITAQHRSGGGEFVDPHKIDIWS